MKTNLEPKDIDNFYITLYFSKDHSDYRKKAIWRAYRDFNRTLRNFTENKNDIKIDWESKLLKYIDEVCNTNFDQSKFDDWHERKTKELCENEHFKLKIGQSQKWINMTLKYCYLLGNEKIPGITKNVDYFHIPIDNIIQKRIFNDFKIKKLDESWSTIDKYKKYKNYQLEFRKHLNDRETAFEKEFKMFNNPE
ncbi:hypothetical protein [Kaistella sp.]|uniref:hypothetical protein n=1 Tax=Kaistella sp. TaxID=2782235 RepID=UPI003C503A18